MESFLDRQRFVLVLDDAVDRVAEDSVVKALSRLDRVVLIETSYATAVQVRHTPELIVHIFEHEPEARRAFHLFGHKRS